MRSLLVLWLAAAPAGAATVGKTAPRFTLPTLGGEKRSLSDALGHVAVIDFWASWCGPCGEELPQLERLAAELKGRARVLAINVDADRKDAKKLLSALGLKKPHFDVLWDPKSKVVSAYNISGMPASFILDKKGIVRFAHVGFHDGDPALWRKEIASLAGD